MKPVNLLPARHRPRSAREGGVGAYVLLAVLAVVLVAAVTYVHTVNEVRTRKAEAARLDRDAQVLEARAAALAPFASFAQVGATRLASVRSLAVGRFDWERLVRETARVLPPTVWLTNVAATTSGDPSATASSSGSATGSSAAAASSSASASSAGSASSSGPSMKISGCAPGHPDVAATLVRLRRLHRAQDVELVQSSRPDSGASSGGSGPATGGGALGCGAHRLSFDATVTFSASDPASSGGSAPRKVPASLGGGQ